MLMILWKGARIAAGAVATIVIAAVFAGGAVLVFDNQNYRALAMETGSMAPGIGAGDVVVVRRVDPYQIRPGAVITFQSPLNRVQVTHRVATVDYTAQGPVFTTKGDANGATDPWVLRYQASGWEVAGVIPQAAVLIARFSTPAGRMVIAAILFLVVFIILLPGLPAKLLPRPQAVVEAEPVVAAPEITRDYELSRRGYAALVHSSRLFRWPA